MKKPKFIAEFSDIPGKRIRMPELSLEERSLNFKEVEVGLTEEMARQEAARCLSCRRCIGCGLCLAECEPQAIVYDDQGCELKIEADAVIFASQACAFDAGRKRELGYADSWNVVTSLELERLMAEDGPFGGLVVRPFDGEIPQRIAFIQCVGSREEAIGANYCSVECCSRTISQALRLKQAIKGANLTVFHRGLRPTGKTSEIELAKLEGAEWASLSEATVKSVREDPRSGSVVVRFSRDGTEAEAAFDLVVLAVGVQARPDFRRHSRLGGVAVNKFGFVDSTVAGVIACKEGVAYAGTERGPRSDERTLIDAVAGASKAWGNVEGRRSNSRPQTVAIVGVGVAGLAAAGELARRGVATVMIDVGDSIGGNLAAMGASAPGDAKTIDDFIEAVAASPATRVMKSTRLKSAHVSDGGVTMVLEGTGGETTLHVDALIVAVGIAAFKPAGFPQSGGVISQEDFRGKVALGQVPKRVAMLQCVGARDNEHPYCSRFCCREALSNALLAKRADPSAEITILHRTIRAYGFDEELYTEAVERGVKFIEVKERPKVEGSGSLGVSGRAADGKEYVLALDALVLSLAHSGDALKEAAAAIGVPLDRLGFIEVSDPIREPFATQSRSIFVCGFARAPVTVEEALMDGLGAAGAVCEYLEGRH